MKLSSFPHRTLLHSPSAMARHALRTHEFKVLLRLLQQDPAVRVGSHRDLRRFLHGVHYLLRTGIPWRDLPRRFGHWNSLFRVARRHEAIQVSRVENKLGPVSVENLAYPKSIQRDSPPAQVPKEFTKDYLEAALIIHDSPKASAAISRRLLQHLLREKEGANQRNLASAIQYVIDEQSLPPYISESLHTLREMGNEVANPAKSEHTAEIIEVEPGEAEWCLDVIDALFDHYFVRPDTARQTKKVLNAKRKEAGSIRYHRI